MTIRKAVARSWKSARPCSPAGDAVPGSAGVPHAEQRAGGTPALTAESLRGRSEETLRGVGRAAEFDEAILQNGGGARTSASYRAPTSAVPSPSPPARYGPRPP